MAPSLENNFTLRSDERCGLRSNEIMLQLEDPRTNYVEKSFSYYGVGSGIVYLNLVKYKPLWVLLK